MVVERLMLKPAEAAQALGIGNTKLYELMASGVLPTVRLGRSVRIPVKELEQWIERQATGESA